ncbi:MAG: ABC-2 family transporter protein [Armatimonadetes bacterium]|nr:ABC-2 family transporter protein [Armatimonadota bacterium]
MQRTIFSHAPLRPLRTWWTVFQVFLQDNLTYRSQALIWMMTDTVPAVIMPLVWLAAYNGRPTIQGFAPPDLVVYYLAVLTLSNFMLCHIMWDIATEVREGRLSIYLTRPFSYAAFQYAGNLSWRMMRMVLFVPVFLLWLLVFRRYLEWRGYDLGPFFWMAVLGGHALSFAISYALGLLALFFTEVRNIFLFYYMPFGFFSGQMVPLSFLPEWAHALARWLPFRYTLAFPVELLMHQLSPGEVTAGFTVLGGWLVVATAAGLLLWRVGLRHYEGVGM